MRNFVSAIIERDSPWSGRVESEPYEGGWASEALWFVRVLDVEGEGTLELVPEISPDGMHWIAHGEPPLRIDAKTAGLHCARLTHFGNWLRLSGNASEGSRFHVLVYLQLKE